MFFCPPLYKGGGTLQGGGFVDYSYLENNLQIKFRNKKNKQTPFIPLVRGIFWNSFDKSTLTLFYPLRGQVKERMSLP
ncbi:MAG: hypothetical protein WCH65_03305 [bacterium]